MRPGLLLKTTDQTPTTRLLFWISLLFAFAVGIDYVLIGTRVAEITQPDGAYYYAVARHMALTGRFEDPIVWHFLHPPAQLLHPPFDYWGGMTALFLVLPLMAFGATTATAFITMSIVSAVVLLAFWYLVCVALPLRYWLSRICAVALFALSTCMREYRFQPESLTVAHLFLVFALAAVARHRFQLALMCGFGLMLARSDGSIVFGLLLLAALSTAQRSERPTLQVARSIGVATACISLYVVWNFLSFGTLAQPGPQMLPFLASYWEVYFFGGEHPQMLSPWLRFSWEWLQRTLQTLFSMRMFEFTPAPQWWLLLALLSGLRWWRHRAPIAQLVWIVCFVGFPLVVWAAGPGFYIGRSPQTFFPAVIVAGAFGVDEVAAALERWSWRTSGAYVRPLLANGVLAVLVGVFMLPLRSPYTVPRAGRPIYANAIAPLNTVFRGEPVMSNITWYVSAYTDSPSVSIPFNGEDAIASVIAKYHARWLVFWGRSSWAEAKSHDWLNGLHDGTTNSVGRFRLQRLTAIQAPLVFRICSETPGSTTCD